MTGAEREDARACGRLAATPMVPMTPGYRARHSASIGAITGRKMIHGIHHVAIHVHDFDRMLRFYEEAFGFEVVGAGFNWKDSELVDQITDVPQSAGRGAMLRSGHGYLEMFEFSAPQPSSDRPLRPFDKGYTHFCLDVSDIEAEYVRLKELGMTFGHPHPLAFGSSLKAIYGRDPEGNVIELQETGPGCDFPLEKR